MFSLFCFTVYTKNNANKSKAYETPKIFLTTDSAKAG